MKFYVYDFFCFIKFLEIYQKYTVLLGNYITIKYAKQNYLNYHIHNVYELLFFF